MPLFDLLPGRGDLCEISAACAVLGAGRECNVKQSKASLAGRIDRGPGREGKSIPLVGGAASPQRCAPSSLLVCRKAYLCGEPRESQIPLGRLLRPLAPSIRLACSLEFGPNLDSAQFEGGFDCAGATVPLHVIQTQPTLTLTLSRPARLLRNRPVCSARDQTLTGLSRADHDRCLWCACVCKLLHNPSRRSRRFSRPCLVSWALCLT